MKIGKVGIGFVTGVVLGGVSGYAFSDKVNSPETEPFDTLRCDDKKAVVLDDGHTRMARRIEYTRGEGRSAQTITGLVRIILSESGVEVAMAPKMTPEQATHPLDVPLSAHHTTNVAANKTIENQWYPGIPDVIVPLVDGDAVKDGQVHVQIDLSGHGPGALSASFEVDCTGNIR